MKNKKRDHAVSVVDAEEVLDFCIDSNGITSITVRTSSCSGCSSGMVEEGLQVHLIGENGQECSTGQLDTFSSSILGGCNNVIVYF